MYANYSRLSQLKSANVTRTLTIVEFPSYQAALDCCHSAEYQAAKQMQLAAATMDLVIIEGYEGPQPD